MKSKWAAKRNVTTDGHNSSYETQSGNVLHPELKFVSISSNTTVTLAAYFDFTILSSECLRFHK